MANKYWYVANDGAGTWGNNPGNWYDVSGGPPNGGTAVSVPTSADDVYFDGNSGAGTVSVAGTRNCRNLIMTGFYGVIQSGTIQIWGPTCTLSVYGCFDPGDNPILYFLGGGTTNLTTNGQSTGSLYVNNTGTTVVLQDNLQTHQASSLILYNGTFDSNDKNVSIGFFTDNNTANAKTLYMRSGTWTIMGAVEYNTTTTAWNIQSPSNMTLNAGTSKLRFMRAKDSIGLASAITSTTQMSFSVRDITSGTGAVWPSSGKLLINGEKMTYSAVASSTPNAYNITITISARGVDGTAASTHSVGSTVFLITPLTTTLTSAIPDGTSTSALNVSTPIDIFPMNGGYELIGSEIIGWTSRTTNTLGSSSIVRGYNSTTPTYHGSGTLVTHCEKTGFNGGGKTYNIIEFVGGMDTYMETTITGGFTATTVQSDTRGIKYLKFDASTYNITNYNLTGASNSPIYVSGLSSTRGGYNVEYISTTTPSFVDTKAGNFIDLII